MALTGVLYSQKVSIKFITKRDRSEPVFVGNGSLVVWCAYLKSAVLIVMDIEEALKHSRLSLVDISSHRATEQQQQHFLFPP